MYSCRDGDEEDKKCFTRDVGIITKNLYVRQKTKGIDTSMCHDHAFRLENPNNNKN